MSDAIKKKKARSPSYPAIDLEQAVERARVLLQKESRHLVPVDTAIGDWGYSPGSGTGLVVIAALKKFGLLEEEGSGTDRRIRLTENAHEILIDERDESPQRTELLRRAALHPRIHADLWNRYGAQLPSDSTLRYELRKMGYGDDASQKLIAEWQRTFEFAHLGEDAEGPPIEEAILPEQGASPYADTASQGGGTASQGGVAAQGQRHTAALTDTSSIQLPLSTDRWATLSAPFPLSPLEWVQMIAVLEAMKPALTTTQQTPEVA